MSESIKKIERCFETLLDDVWAFDYKDENGYEVRITQDISAQLIEDVHEAMEEALDKERKGKEITLDFLKSMLKDKQKQIHDEPDCELWDDEQWQLKKVIELVEMEITEEEALNNEREGK